jgi:hypothetical protein
MIFPKFLKCSGQSHGQLILCLGSLHVSAVSNFLVKGEQGTNQGQNTTFCHHEAKIYKNQFTRIHWTYMAKGVFCNYLDSNPITNESVKLITCLRLGSFLHACFPVPPIEITTKFMEWSVHKCNIY